MSAGVWSFRVERAVPASTLAGGEIELNAEAVHAGQGAVNGQWQRSHGFMAAGVDDLELEAEVSAAGRVALNGPDVQRVGDVAARGFGRGAAGPDAAQNAGHRLIGVIDDRQVEGVLPGVGPEGRLAGANGVVLPVVAAGIAGDLGAQCERAGQEIAACRGRAVKGPQTVMDLGDRRVHPTGRAADGEEMPLGDRRVVLRFHSDVEEVSIPAAQPRARPFTLDRDVGITDQDRRGDAPSVLAAGDDDRAAACGAHLVDGLLEHFGNVIGFCAAPKSATRLTVRRPAAGQSTTTAARTRIIRPRKNWIIRDFPFAVSLEPIQARLAIHFTTVPPASSYSFHPAGTTGPQSSRMILSRPCGIPAGSRHALFGLGTLGTLISGRGGSISASPLVRTCPESALAL